MDQLIQQALSLPYEIQREILQEIAALREAEAREAAKSSFLSYVKAMWPNFIEGRHHKIVADAFDRVIKGELKRLIINMAPRHTKSEFASVYLPSCFLGHYPDRKVIQCSNVADLAIGFGRQVRDMLGDIAYQKTFPGVALKADSKAAGHWHTSVKGGEYFAIGVEGKVTGKGADLLIIDDPHSEQEAKNAETNPEVFNTVFDWYTSGPRQRLQPDAAIVVVMTRWGKRDLTGRLIKAQTDSDDEFRDQWEVIELPAIMPSGEPMWPEFWKKEALLATKAGLPVSKWSAQYQQTPTSEEGALVKRDWWKEWDEPAPPKCQFIIQSWDTAYLKTQRADFSACTTWGVFYMEDLDTGDDVANIILLNAYMERLEFPELKRRAKASYLKWKPDAFIVEAKAAGAPLSQELRAIGIPVSEYSPSKGNDKIVRVNSVTDIFQSGMVWYPVGKKWAEEVIEQFAEFPNGDHDDLVDSGTQALMRFRRGGFIPLPSDYEDDFKRKPIREYY